MSEEILIGPNPCHSCGGEYGEHDMDCRRHQHNIPPVYDLAEFERQLERAWKMYADCDNPAALTRADAISTILTALKSSKREAK